MSRLLAGAAIAVLVLTQGADAYDSEAAEDAANGEACEDAQPFYWEIGGSSGSPIVSGQVGGSTYGRNTVVAIASASKWIFGAYVIERYGGIPGGASGADIVASLDMLNGHTSFSPVLCTITLKVGTCFTIASNDNVDSGKIGDFNYGGGDGQYAAASSGLLGLGNMTKAQLISEMNSYLSLDGSFAFTNPGVSGGLQASAAGVAEFLQAIMDGTYEISNYLDYSPVATTCGNCSSPMGSVNMHYTLNHWIEDQTSGTLPHGKTPGTGDGAFSSPGGLGFYPWITSDLDYYGIVSREDDTAGSYEDSLICGQAIRAAFLEE
ncbi:MAG: hypothetical protein H6923_05695 [Alphaproteobacteria bacterium]|nr:hypothetical protein [Alphaproteobacteria bacterium]